MSWLTAGTGLMRGRVPEKMPFDAPAPEKMGAAVATPFGETGAGSLPVPTKMGAFGDDGAFAGGTIGKIGFGDEGAFGSGVGKMGMGDLSTLAIQESTAAAQQGQAGQQPDPGAGLNAGIGGATPGTGGIGQTSGEFSVLNQYDTAFRNAAAKFGIPANYLKAIAMIERGWEGSGVSESGAVGIMQVMPEYWGDKGYDIYSPEGNIMTGALALTSFYDDVKDEAIRIGMDPWEAAARAYFSGSNWKNGWVDDDYGTRVDVYGDRFSQYLNQLGGGTVGTDGAGGGWHGAFTTMFGSPSVGDYGYNAPNNLGYYEYGNQYGMDGVGHTGIDQPMNFGTPYRAPMGGTVMCAGTGVGQGADGGGCASFTDTGNGGPGSAIQGVGRVEVLLDNGAVLIFGHSRTSAFRPNQRFEAGAVIGTSGGQNGGHVHLEARVKDASTPSGWRIVDPRTVLGAGGVGGGATVQPAYSTTPPGYPSAGQRMLDIIRRM